MRPDDRGLLSPPNDRLWVPACAGTTANGAARQSRAPLSSPPPCGQGNRIWRLNAGGALPPPLAGEGWGGGVVRKRLQLRPGPAPTRRASAATSPASGGGKRRERHSYANSPDPLRGGVGGGGSRGSQTSPIIRAISSRSACHKTGKILPKTLPKAQRRWYIPPAPDGLAAHGDAFSGRYWDGSIGAPRAAALFRSPASGQGAQRLYRGVEQPGSSSGS